MAEGTKSLIAILTAIVGVAIVAVLVSNKSSTTQVISSFGNAYAAALREAVSPVTSS